MRRAAHDAKRAADWPRYLETRRLASGGIAYYWKPPARDRARGFSGRPEPLGRDYHSAASRARMLNEALDGWRAGRDVPPALRTEHAGRVGTVDWWVDQFMRSARYERLAPRSREDYREALARLAELPTRTGGRVGDLACSSLTPAAVDKIYERLRAGGRVQRQANYALDVARVAWSTVARAHPGHFLIPVATPDGIRPAPLNPFAGVDRVKGSDTAIPATRAEAYALARQLEADGHPGIAATALIAFEWLFRPTQVLRGELAWSDWRPAHRPGEALIAHYKTGARGWTPLDAEDEANRIVPLYPELEALLARLPRLGAQIVMFRPQRGAKDGGGHRVARLYSQPYAQHLVQRARAAAGLPAHVTLEACRHGGMTELGDAGLTEQQIMALSFHVTPSAARLYVKRTEAQRLVAARARRAWVEKRGKG